MGLEDYQHKRQFNHTSEPQGKIFHRNKEALRFVIQKHQATHLHYDFRLELNGVLKSWAVPKGPSLNPADKRLAIMVEDHPLEYGTFEGIIPKGQYGAGQVSIWDQGTYIASQAHNREETEKIMEEGLRQGRLTFILNGQKLKGEFSLVRLKRGNENQWLLIKKKDSFSSDIDITSEANSLTKQVSSWRNMSFIPSRIESKKSPSSHSHEPQQAEIAKTEMPHSVKPMLATLVDIPFDRQNWIFEIKWDGYRTLAEIHKGRVELYSRQAKSFNQRFPSILEELKKMKVDVLLDGEIVVLDQKGNPSFQLVQNYQRSQEGTLVYYVFDVLYLEGYDLRNLPLLQRKKILKKLLPIDSPIICYCNHVEEKGIAFFQQAAKRGLEGMIAKHGDSTYHSGRSHEWLKIKTHKQQETIICGFTEPKGSRQYLGSLILGAYNEDHELSYIGHAGSGFADKQLAEVYQRLKPLIQTGSPFKRPPRMHEPIIWVKPQLVCEVKFAEWTHNAQMRQAVFIDFRDDKKASDVVIEKSIAFRDALTEEKEDAPKAKNTNKKHFQTDFSVAITHPEKIYWPQEGYTKADLIEYYSSVATYILPYLKDRPETLHRYPNGIDKASFYQKNASNVPNWIKTEQIKHGGKADQYIIVDDEKSLLYVANLGCIELHPFHSRIQSLHAPDYLILDLDPEDISFDKVVEAAQVIHELLDQLDIPHVCKTSGSRGLHIYIPLGAQYTYVQSGQFSKILARLTYEALPNLISLEHNPQKRQGKIYIDFLRNSFGQTVAAPYSVRPKPGATVSTPLKWSEVKKGLDPREFTIKTLGQRLQKVGDLFEIILGPGIDMQKCLKKLERLVVHPSL